MKKSGPALLLSIVIVVVVVILAAGYLILSSNVGIQVVPNLEVKKEFKINGMAMSPTYNNDDTFLITPCKSSECQKNIKRGDVIVLDNNFVRRIIGLPGETIMIKNNNIYINGQILDESRYLKDSTTIPGIYAEEGESIVISADKYFAMGDNRMHSFDSRDSGLISIEQIVGYTR